MIEHEKLWKAFVHEEIHQGEVIGEVSVSVCLDLEHKA
jgi:hypothetical protein